MTIALQLTQVEDFVLMGTAGSEGMGVSCLQYKTHQNQQHEMQQKAPLCHYPQLNKQGQNSGGPFISYQGQQLHIVIVPPLCTWTKRLHNTPPLWIVLVRQEGLL